MDKFYKIEDKAFKNYMKNYGEILDLKWQFVTALAVILVVFSFIGMEYHFQKKWIKSDIERNTKRIESLKEAGRNRETEINNDIIKLNKKIYEMGKKSNKELNEVYKVLNDRIHKKRYRK